MSFGYNPMHPMHHLLSNGTNGFTMQLQHAGLNPLNNPLAASLNQMAALASMNPAQQQQQQQQQQQCLDGDKLGRNHSQSVGAGSIPMDLESNEPKEHDNRVSAEQAKNELQSETNMIFNQQMMNGFMPGMYDPMMGMLQFLGTTMGQTPQAQPAQLPPPAEAVVGAATPLQPVKEIITCKSCTLFPPSPNTPAPTTRDRPLGCRTVFVGGLPENCTEQILHEVFERCGEITSLRLSVKNFCHIRFVYEASVDSAIYLSGYRLRINPQNETSNCGRLHVDYAQARDDQYEFECRQRQLQREQRHREKNRKNQRDSPPLIVHFTDHESGVVSEKLKTDEGFLKAVLVLVAWLERGECSKRNSNAFYSMIQSTFSHVRRLSNDKYSMEEQLEKAKLVYKKQMQNLLLQFTQIEKVFNAASHKKCWDHFTKAQRKNIDVWKKQSLEMRSMQLVQDEDEMEMSDDDRDSVRPPQNKRTRYDNDKLKEENDSLKCQLQAYKNEVNLVKSDVKSDVDIKIQQIQVLQETIRNMQTQLLENKGKEKESQTRIQTLEAKLKEANVKQLLLKTKIINASSKNPNSSKTSEIDESEVLPEMVDSPAAEPKFTPDSVVASPTHDVKVELAEGKLIGLLSTFLAIHPFGATADQLLGYLVASIPTVRRKDLEDTLHRFPNLFQDEGSKDARKWKFRGFDVEDVKIVDTKKDT